MKIKTVTVIGANGYMGCNISGIFASFGNAKVYMVCRSMEKAINAVDKAVKSVRADAIREKLIAKDFYELGECIKASDLIFESVSENYETKLNVNQIIDQYVNENTIIATGTSGLSINSLAESLHKRTRKNYIGLHFYNPPYSMTLCEVIPTKYTEKDHLDDIKKYLRFSLYRTVVEVIDSPAFLGNRIGFQFINEALQYANKYKDNGGIDYIDSILGQFSGRSMPPLKTSDFVGLDVHKAIVDNIYAHTGDYARNTFVLPKFAENLILENKLGLKSGSGLYKTVISESNLKKVYVYDINTNEYRDCVSYNFSFSRDIISALKNGDYDKAFKILVINHSNEAEICLTFLLKYVLYSLTLTNLIGDRIESADDVMATGFNWAPPLSVIDALGGKEKFYFLVNERLDSKLIQNIDLISLLKAIPNKSSYDYRRYFKAR